MAGVASALVAACACCWLVVGLAVYFSFILMCCLFVCVYHSVAGFTFGCSLYTFLVCHWFRVLFICYVDVLFVFIVSYLFNTTPHVSNTLESFRR